ncbi:acyltransferase [Pseudomonas sp. NPDC086581]|uniref:acyltransferase n=1 Tax=Pseudomonas sp. NPDC086581 TaxID=3364432 RepID=UPI003803ACB9
MVSESWCTNLRTFSMFLVVALHASGIWLFGNIESFNWSFANVVNSVGRPAVPFFFMISGYLLCGSKQLPFKVFFKKRFNRIFPSFAFVTAFALLYRYVNGEEFAFRVLWDWVYNPQYYHLGFLYALCMVYLGIWLVRPSSDSINPLAGAIGCLCFILIVGGGIAQHERGEALRMETYAGYLFYAFAGYFLGKIPRSWSAVIASAALGFMSLAFIVIQTYSLSLQTGSLNQFWYGYMSMPVILGSFFLFYASRHIFDLWAPSKFVLILSNASLFVYCFHPFIIDVFLRNVKSGVLLENALLGMAAIVIFCVGVLTFIYTAWNAASRRLTASDVV